MSNAPSIADSVEAARPRYGGPSAVVAIAAMAILIAAPSLPSAWAGLTQRRAVTVHTPVMLGYVTVARCERAELYFDWSCHGLFRVNDALAEPYKPVPNVSVANDPRRYHAGDTLDTALPFDSRTGYRWGSVQDAKTVGLWVGVLLCVAAPIAAWSLRRRLRWVSRLALLGGVGLVVGLAPVL